MSNTMQARDRWIPWYFVLFFAVVAAVNAVMVTLAIRTHTGTVTDHPYEIGIKYNEVVEASEKQDALGWSSAINYSNDKLHFTLKNKAGHVIVPEKMIAYISRPTQAGMDFTVDMKTGNVPVTFPLKGLWEVRIDAYYHDNHYQQSKRIVVQ